MPNSLTYFPVSGDWRNVSDPDISGQTNSPEVEIIEGFVTFYPRLPDGFVAYVDDYLLTPATAAVQTITITGATAGTFTLTYDGQTTTDLAYNASASTVQTALRALSTIGSGNVNVSGDAGGPYTVTFAGSMVNIPVDIIEIEDEDLDGVNATAIIDTTTPGVAAVNAQQTVAVTGTPTAGTFKLTFAGQTTGNIAYNATIGTVQTALQALTTIGVNNCSVTGTTGNYVVTFVGALGGQFIPPMTVTPSITGGSATVSQTTVGVGAVNEVQTLTISNATSGNYTLQFGLQTTVPIAYNAAATTVQSALVNLSNVGLNNIGVTGNNGGPYTITFKGTLSGTNVDALSPDDNSLIGSYVDTTVVHTVRGTPQISKDSAVAIPARKGRIWNGTLSTINVVDSPKVQLVADSAALALQDLGYTHLIYDVQFSSVSYNGGNQKVNNFAFVAPTDNTEVCITDPDLRRLDYQGP